MEEENRKARRAARREYNEAIRDLTAFVKKRDKRVAKVGQCQMKRVAKVGQCCKGGAVSDKC